MLLEAANWNGAEHPAHARGARAAQRGLGALREGPSRRSCMHAQAVATRCCSSSAARGSCPGRSTSAGRAAPAPIALRAAPRERRCSAREIARERWREILARSASQSSGERRPQRHRAALRRGDVTREVDLIEEVARIDGARAAAGDAAPAARRRRRLTPRAAACAAAPRTRWPAAACARSSAGASPTRAARPPAPPRR